MPDGVFTPPNCFTLSYGVRPPSAGLPVSVDTVTVSKPNPAAPAALRVDSASPVVLEKEAVSNGVDQRALHECMASGSQDCRSSVKGLDACVRARLVCNLPANPQSAVKSFGSPLRADEAQRLATSMFTMPAGADTNHMKVQVGVAPQSLTSGLRQKVSRLVGDSTNLTVVESDEAVNGPASRADTTYRGFTVNVSPDLGETTRGHARSPRTTLDNERHRRSLLSARRFRDWRRLRRGPATWLAERVAISTVSPICGVAHSAMPAPNRSTNLRRCK